jgi:hypothetical protein
MELMETGDTADLVTDTDTGTGIFPPNHDSTRLYTGVSPRLSLFLVFYNYTGTYIQHRKDSNQISAISRLVQMHPDLALRDRSSRHDLSPTRTLHDHRFPRF